MILHKCSFLDYFYCMKNKFGLITLITGISVVSFFYAAAQKPADWLIGNELHIAAVSRDHKNITLTNGLLKRTFRLTPNVACTDFQNLSSGEQLLRAIEPEASVTINSKTYSVGGLYGQENKAYLLTTWADTMKSNANDFQFDSLQVTGIFDFLEWKTRCWIPKKDPTGGKTIIFYYHSNLPELAGVIIRIHYSLFDNIPLLCKWITIENKNKKAVHINQVVNEVLAAPEEESAVGGGPAGNTTLTPHGIYVENDFTFNGSMTAQHSDQATHWVTDSTYTSQVNYDLKAICVLKVFSGKRNRHRSSTR